MIGQSIKYSDMIGQSIKYYSDVIGQTAPTMVSPASMGGAPVAIIIAMNAVESAATCAV